MGPSTFGPGMTETTRTYRFESSTLRFPGFRVSSSGILPVQAFFSLPAGRLPRRGVLESSIWLRVQEYRRLLLTLGRGEEHPRAGLRAQPGVIPLDRTPTSARPVYHPIFAR